MFNTVRKWVDEQPDKHSLNSILGSASVKAGHNHKVSGEKDVGHSHGALGGHGKTAGSIWSEIQSRDLGSMGGQDGNSSSSYMNASPSAGSPSLPPASPNYGYQNHGGQGSRPGSAAPPSSGGYLAPGPQGHYQGGPPPGNYDPYAGSQGYQQPPYGGGPPQQWQQGPPPQQYPPYPNQQPSYPQYPPGPGYGGY